MPDGCNSGFDVDRGWSYGTAQFPHIGVRSELNLEFFHDRLVYAIAYRMEDRLLLGGRPEATV